MVGAAALATFTGAPTRADGPTEVQYQIASGLYRRLTSGEFLLHTNPLYPVVLSKVIAQDYIGAADAITHPTSGADAFYNNTVADLMQTVNNTGTAVGERNDITAMMLCAVKYDMTPLELLTSDFVCFDPTETPRGVGYAIDDAACNTSNFITSGTDCNTGHYMAVWSSTNPRTALQKAPRPISQGTGILTSWTWAKEFDAGGTARRNEKAVNENLFLASMEALRSEGGIPTDGIRKDIPSSDPMYNADCIKCHSGMDWRVGAYLDKQVTPVANQLVKFERFFRDKLNVIEPDGGRNVVNTSFKYFFTQQQNQIYGINESKHTVKEYSPGVKYIEGQGLGEIADIIGNSRGYHEGFVKRVVAQMYMNRLFSITNFTQDEWDILNGQSETIKAFTDVFYQEANFRKLYGRIAVWYTVGAQ